MNVLLTNTSSPCRERGADSVLPLLRLQRGAATGAGLRAIRRGSAVPKRCPGDRLRTPFAPLDIALEHFRVGLCIQLALQNMLFKNCSLFTRILLNRVKPAAFGRPASLQLCRGAAAAPHHQAAQSRLFITSGLASEMAQDTASQLEAQPYAVRSLPGSPFGVEVADFDLTQPVTQETIDHIKQDVSRCKRMCCVPSSSCNAWCAPLRQGGSAVSPLTTQALLSCRHHLVVFRGQGVVSGRDQVQAPMTCPNCIPQRPTRSSLVGCFPGSAVSSTYSCDRARCA